MAKIIQDASLYRNTNETTDESDSDSDETEPSDDDFKIDDVNKRDAHRRTPLHLAVLNEDVNLVKQLLDHDADVNLVDDVGSNPLHRAAENGIILWDCQNN